VRPGEVPDVELPAVVKPRFGSWGADVLRAESREALVDALAGIADRPWFARHGAVVQPLIPPMGRDLRVLVAGGRAVGAEVRVAAPGEWRTNISLGGSHLQCSIDVVAERLAVAAADAVGGEFVGVDLMPTLEGYVVLEVNAAVEFDDGYSLDGDDVFQEVARALALAVPEPTLI
jgi:RimK family alpha-L-glutamate ligase